MAHFYASIKGNRGDATRMGTKQSGIAGHIRGWDSGVWVDGRVGPDGRDVFDVYATGGSNSSTGSKLIATIDGDQVRVGDLGDFVLDFGGGS